VLCLFPTLLDKYIAREIFSTLLAVTSVLMLIIIGNLFIRLLGEAAEGKIPQDIILPLLALVSFKGVVLLLPISLFLAVLLSLGRFYRDSEMAALRAIGIGYSDLLRPIIVMAIAIALFLTIMVAWVLPWVVAVSDEMKEVASKRTDIVGITPGRFVADPQATRVLYVEEMSEDREVLRGIFISLVEKDKDVILTAETARQEVDPETQRRYIVLNNGYRYDAPHGRGEISRLFYREHAVLLPEVTRSTTRTRDAYSIQELWRSDVLGDKAELQWRLSFPISALILAILAIPLSYSSPRQGRYGKLAIAIVIYGLYSNFLVMSKTWVDKGQLIPEIGNWWVHIVLLLLTVLLVIHQYGVAWTLKHGLLNRKI
jgi:lipopolysaccharide export system permease protein